MTSEGRLDKSRWRVNAQTSRKTQRIAHNAVAAMGIKARSIYYKLLFYNEMLAYWYWNFSLKFLMVLGSSMQTITEARSLL